MLSRGFKARVCSVLLSLALAASLFVGALQPAAWAQGQASNKLTLRDAIQRALANSEDVKKQEYAVEKAEKQRDEASDAVDFIPAPLANTPQGDIAWSNFLKADYNWQIQKVTLEAVKNQVTQAVVQAYYNVIYKAESLKSAEAALKRDEKALQVARAVYQVGGIPSATGTMSEGLQPGTKASLMAAEAKAQSSRKAVETAKAELDKAYVTFNRLVGLNPGDRPVLIEPLAFAPIKVDSIDAEAERAVESSKEIEIKEKLKEIAEVDVNYPYTITMTGLVWQELGLTEPEVNIKEQDIAKAKNDTRQNLRNLYNDIRSVEEQYAALQDALRSAEETLRVTKAFYEVGMTTEAKLAEAEAAYADLKAKAVGLAVQHAVQLAGYCLMTGRPVEDGSFADAVVDKSSAQPVLQPAAAGAPVWGSTAVFKLGEKKYTLDGREMEMDAAPAVRESRVFLPLRYVANALGAPDDGIKWDGAEGKVVIEKGSRKVELAVGSREFLVDGKAASMDVEPWLDAGGRVMVPVGFVAKAFGADVRWDGAARTVTIKY